LLRFNDPGAEDKLTEVTGKIDVVKSVMKENISKILENEAKLEHIEAASEALNEKAQDFRKGSKQLNDMMWWRMWKMRLLIGGLIVAVLLIIIVPTAISAQSSSNSSSKNKQ
jgi:vesicle-associated membrane protein 72